MEAGVPLDTLLPEGFRERREECEDVSCYDTNPDANPKPAPDANAPLTHARLGRMIAMIGSFALAVDKSSHLRGDVDPSVNPVPSVLEPAAHQSSHTATPQFKKSLTLQYDAFRSSMEKEEAKAFYARLVVVWVLFITFWAVCFFLFPSFVMADSTRYRLAQSYL
jgi:potassium channel subfamily K